MRDISMVPAKEDGAQKTLVQRIVSHRNALTLKEFAELFSISYKTAFEMATRSRIPAMQIGSNWRIDPIKLAAWVEEQEVTASARRLRPARVRHRAKT